ncbi:hypothetical protein PT285_04295 [Lactobacillus sp. ESL0791]|uniref:hypothetical protein n=1 Tax=Lactobacillus sp. ESL0791 TaxID=2983234 RepID=UPI0023F87A65|nr:hypothetical protein [Lactobacillus sp. ESL0791]MDF7638619.1 hypothetical protein [Lactobacillus sp. ESL0791]
MDSTKNNQRDMPKRQKHLKFILDFVNIIVFMALVGPWYSETLDFCHSIKYLAQLPDFAVMIIFAIVAAPVYYYLEKAVFKVYREYQAYQK